MSSVADRRRTSTREHLIDAAMEGFRTRGVAASGVDGICRSAGVTKGVFAHHFPGGKQELAQAVVERTTADLVALIERLEQRGADNAPELIRGFFHTYARLFERHGWAFGCPVAATVVDTGDEPFALATAAAAFDTWRASLRDIDPALRGGVDTLIVAAFEGALLLARASHDAEAFRQVGDSLARLLAAGTAQTSLDTSAVDTEGNAGR